MRFGGVAAHLRRGPPGSRRRHESIYPRQTEDEFPHETFINAIWFEGADTVNLERSHVAGRQRLDERNTADKSDKLT